MGNGEPWNPTTLPKVRLHAWRWSFALLLLSAGAELKTISAALGHSTIAVAGDRYAHVTPSLQQNAASLLDRVVASELKVSGENHWCGGAIENRKCGGLSRIIAISAVYC